MLNFVCFDRGRFVLRNAAHDLTVSGPSDAGLRIDHKMGYHRLLEEAQEAGVEVHVVHGNEEFDVSGASAKR